MAQLTPFLLRSVCVRVRREEGRGPVLISRLQLHLSPAHLIMTTTDRTTTFPCITSPLVIYKTRVRRSFKGWMCFTGCSGALIPSEAAQITATVTAREKPAILWRNSVYAQFRNNHWAWRLLTPTSHQRKRKRICFIVISALCTAVILGGKDNQKTCSSFLLICYTMDLLVTSVTDKPVLATESGCFLNSFLSKNIHVF